MTVDVAIIGSGFAGSITALCLRQRGFKVALVERGRHPRFAIGESSTPLANLLLEELAERYDLPPLRAFSTWGRWQRARPDVACGLKRGFSFLFHQQGNSFEDDATRARQLMVAASPHDAVADTHWYRPDFDHALLRLAIDVGAHYFDETVLDGAAAVPGGMQLTGRRHDVPVSVTAGFVVDASGPRGALSRLLALGEAPLRWLPPTQGLYSHFEDVGLWEQVAPPDAVPPYPIDAAAVHHVFPGGWIWILRFNNGITSAGAALTDPVADAIRASEGEAAWMRLLDTLPSVQAQFSDARATLPFVHSPRLAFRSPVVHGDCWAMLPSAAGVIDPLLSTGFPLTLLGITRLLDILDTTGAGEERNAALQRYAAVTLAEIDATEQLVGALYASMHDATLFKRLTLLYFAAASFSETVRRLGSPHLAPGFLLHAHPAFGDEMRAITKAAAQQPDGADRDTLLKRVDRAILPFDVAGLSDRARNDWYPVLEDDLVLAAAKVHATPHEIREMLARSAAVI